MNGPSDLPTPPPGWNPNQNSEEGGQFIPPPEFKEERRPPIEEDVRPQPFAPQQTEEPMTTSPDAPYPNSQPVGDKTKKKKRKKKIQVVPFITMIVFLIILIVAYSAVRSIRVEKENPNLYQIEAADIKFKSPKEWNKRDQKSVSGSKQRIFVGSKNSSRQGMFITFSELKKEAKVKDKKVQQEIEKKLTQTGAGKLKKEFKKIGGKEAVIYSYRSDGMNIQSGFVFDGKKQWQLSCQYQNKTTQNNCNTIIENIKF